MFETTCSARVINVEHETQSDVVWIDREIVSNGKITANCVPVPAWGDAAQMVAAAKKIARLTF